MVYSLSPLTGGVGTSVRALCGNLSRLGISTEIWTTLRKYPLELEGEALESLRQAGVQVRFFPLHPWRGLGTRYAFSPALSSALSREVSHFDLVHIHGIWLHPTAAAVRACRRASVPYLLAPCGSLDPFCLRTRWFLKLPYGFLIERTALRSAAAVHFTSPLEQKTSWTFGIRGFSVVVPCALESLPSPLPPAGTFRGKYPSIGGKRVLLFLGRLHSKKRLDIVAEVFCRVAARREDVHLVVAGPDEGARKPAERLLAKAGVLDRVIFTGLLDARNKWAAYRDSDLFLLPSEQENFSVAALEALAAGVPVLLSKQVALSDWVRSAHAGSILPRDAAAWSEEICRLLDNPSLCQAMGEAGRRLAESEFSGPEVARKMLLAYEKILGGAPGG